MANPHTQIINGLAKEHLKPLGISQKGRSRTWYDDHGWWVILIEFQPSSWAKGSYLNVGAMWLWMVKDDFSFDYGNRVSGLIKYQNDQQFAKEALSLVELAREKVEFYRDNFSSIDKVARRLLRTSKSSIWPLFHAGIASGLSGRKRSASRCLKRILKFKDDRGWVLEAKKSAQEWLDLVTDPDSFKRKAETSIYEARSLLKLPEIHEIQW
jgi:hypothetical protein